MASSDSSYHECWDMPRYPAPATLKMSDVVIEDLEPLVNSGRFAAKAVVGDPVKVRAAVFSHGHEAVYAQLRYRQAGTPGKSWACQEMTPVGNDLFEGSFVPLSVGEWEFEVIGTSGSSMQSPCTAMARVFAQRPKAAFSSWYELFPRSASPDPTRAGTLDDVAGRLDYISEMGFDVLYLPPIHPIGTTARKGPRNSTVANPGDVGSPWAIGSPEGGHDTVAACLGGLEAFDRLLDAARDHAIELAMDLAFQCSPDHPWVSEHPEWFRHRPDGTIACAENPPKRYEDIFPFDFSSPNWEELWNALLEVTLVWIRRGVRIFRVDNPHTKPFAFWEWMISQVRSNHPEVIFLSEAFTRPHVMHRLAKLGFDQSYTYFTWRNSKAELTGYFEELAHGPGANYLRPNVWPNTPDILAASLREGGRPAFIARLVLAAGLSANYGIYGPLYELGEHEPLAEGSEEYLRSEKYEVRFHDLDDPSSLAGTIARVNATRRAHPALQRDRHLHFHHVDNEQLICWSKTDPELTDVVIGLVNLDWRWPQSGFVTLDLKELGIADTEEFFVHDVLDGATYAWRGARNFVMLDPKQRPAHLLTVERVA